MPELDYQPSDPSTLPGLPGRKDERIRKDMAQRGRDDLFYLCKVILGYDLLNPATHGALCRFVGGVEWPRRMVLMPRDTFKTTICTIAHSIQMIVRDPNISILMISDTETNASNFMLEIQQHFEHNTLFRWLYPEIIPENFNTTIWSSTRMVVKRDKISRAPTVDAIGAFGGVESRHYDYIKADDLATERSIRSDIEMDKLIKWSGGLESLLSGYHARLDFVGSRRKKGDLYEHLEKFFASGADREPIGPHAHQSGELLVFSRAILEEGESIFPERIPKPFLLRLRKFYPERYHSQYANSPKGSGLNVFEKEWLRYARALGDGKIEARHKGEVLELTNWWNLERMILFDPSVAEKQTSSQQAIIVVGKGRGPFRYVLETHIGHYPPDEAVTLLYNLYAKWKPGLISIEKRGYQGSIIYWLHEVAEQNNLPYLPIIEYPPPGKTSRAHLPQQEKKERIRGLQPMVRAGYLWVFEEQTELIDQLEFYPNVRHDDGLDALAQGLEYWPSMMDEDEQSERVSDEERYLTSVGMPSVLLLGRGQEQEAWSEEKFLSRFDFTGYGLKEA
jgi:hypothetical protein